MHSVGTKHTFTNVVFQDPAFTEIDRIFIGSLGYDVVSTPAAFDSIWETTFLFAPHLENTVFATALKNAHPALCIGNSDVKIDDCLRSSTAWVAGIGEVLGTYALAMQTKPMPDFDRDTWCQFTNLYWRDLGCSRSDEDFQVADG